MLTFLADLTPLFSPLNVFRYITFRTAFAAACRPAATAITPLAALTFAARKGAASIALCRATPAPPTG